MLKKFALLTVLLGGMSLPAQATTVTYLITGVIFSENAATLQVGDAMTATITVDLATPASFNPVPTFAQYAGAVVSASFSLGGTPAGTGSSLLVEMYNDHGGDEFKAGGSSLVGSSFTGSFEGQGLGQVIVTVADTDATAFNSVAIQVPTDLAPFEDKRIILDFGGGISVQGNITSIQLVPEPSIAALLGAGALAFARRRRHTAA